MQKKNDVKFRRPRNKKECVEKCVGCGHGGRKDTAAEFQKLRRRPFDGCRTIITIIFIPFDRVRRFSFFRSAYRRKPALFDERLPFFGEYPIDESLRLGRRIGAGHGEDILADGITSVRNRILRGGYAVDGNHMGILILLVDLTEVGEPQRAAFVAVFHGIFSEGKIGKNELPFRFAVDHTLADVIFQQIPRTGQIVPREQFDFPVFAADILPVDDFARQDAFELFACQVGDAVVLVRIQYDRVPGNGRFLQSGIIFFVDKVKVSRSGLSDADIVFPFRNKGKTAVDGEIGALPIGIEIRFGIDRVDKGCRQGIGV